jgi:MoaA/NifB/PqqE/SkfB family radical SAM enzyme
VMVNKDWFDRLKRRDGFPKLHYAELHLTDKCNLNCYYCNQKLYRFGGYSELKTDVVLRTMEGMREIGLDGVRLSGGGEPSLHLAFDQIIQYLVSSDLTLWDLTTNGMALSFDVLRAMSQLRWLSATISIAASDEEQWMSITGGKKGDFKKVISNVREMVRLKKAASSKLPQIGLKFGIDKYTYRSLVEAYELACDLEVDSVLFTSYNAVEYERDVLESIDCIIDQLKNIDAENRRSGRIDHVRYSLGDLLLNKVLEEEIMTTAEKEGDKAATCHDDYVSDCFMPWYGTMIRASGEVKACCAGCDLIEHLGNVNDTEIKDIWYGDAYRKLRIAFEKAIFDKDSQETLIKRLRASKCIGGTNADIGCPVKIGREMLEEVYKNS